MRHLVLIGEFDLTVDEKNRLLVPSDIRRAMNSERDGDAFFLVMGINRKPWLYPEHSYEELVSQVPPDITPGEEMLAYDQLNFAMASRLEWDGQGRVLIPEKTLRRTGLDREITMIGVRDHLELWNRAEWELQREELFKRAAEIALRAKKARQAPER